MGLCKQNENKKIIDESLTKMKYLFDD